MLWCNSSDLTSLRFHWSSLREASASISFPCVSNISTELLIFSFRSFCSATPCFSAAVAACCTMASLSDCWRDEAIITSISFRASACNASAFCFPMISFSIVVSVAVKSCFMVTIWFCWVSDCCSRRSTCLSCTNSFSCISVISFFIVVNAEVKSCWSASSSCNSSTSWAKASNSLSKISNEFCSSNAERTCGFCTSPSSSDSSVPCWKLWSPWVSSWFICSPPEPNKCALVSVRNSAPMLVFVSTPETTAVSPCSTSLGITSSVCATSNNSSESTFDSPVLDSVSPDSIPRSSAPSFSLVDPRSLVASLLDPKSCTSPSSSDSPATSWKPWSPWVSSWSVSSLSSSSVDSFVGVSDRLSVTFPITPSASLPLSMLLAHALIFEIPSSVVFEP